MEIHFKAMEKIIVIMLLVHNQISILIFCIISKGHQFLLFINNRHVGVFIDERARAPAFHMWLQ